MKRALRYMAIFLFALIGLLANEIHYGLMQLQGQIKVLSEAEDIEIFLNDPDFPDSLKTKILLVQKVRNFAVSELGMTDSKNYTTLYNQHNKPTLWVVTAAPKFSLEPYEWKFPLVGGFPYKGFFDEELVKQEAKKMQNLGYDTEIDLVSAWSTLGWFKDPILSNNLNQSEGDLANLIIHELTHTTIFIKDSVDLNENLASFVGHKGAQLFLEQYDDSLKSSYLNKLKDRKLYKDFLIQKIAELKSFYEQSATIDIEKRLQLKEQKIESIRKELNLIPFSNKIWNEYLFEKSADWNNAFFAGVNTYGSQQEYFEQILEEKFKGDLKAFLQSYKEKYPK